MVKFLFEDKETSPCNILLKTCYNGDNIIFSEGSQVNKFVKKIKEYPNDMIIIYFDLPPNNKYAHDNYDKLIDYIYDNDLANVLVIPIICIEYIILKMLISDNYLSILEKNEYLVNKLILNFEYTDSDVQAYIQQSNYLQSSLEHVYKNLLVKLAPKCMQNKFDYLDTEHTLRKNTITGTFYEKDCDCEKKYCKANIEYLSIAEKAEKLYAALPLLFIKNTEHLSTLSKFNIKVHNITLTDVYDKIEQLYCELCANMNIASILIERFGK